MSETNTDTTPERKIVLPELHKHQCGVVCAIDAENTDILRLQTMGVSLGRKVELINSGDPLILRVLGTRLGVSARLAQQVWVSTCPDPVCKHE